MGIDVARFRASDQHGDWAKGAGRGGPRGAGVLLDSLTSPWQVPPDALHALLHLGRVVRAEVAQMTTVVEHALSNQLGTGIGHVTGIRALHACGTTRAAFTLEQRRRAVMSAAASGRQLGTIDCGLPVDDRPDGRGLAPPTPH